MSNAVQVFINWFIHDVHGEVYDNFHKNRELVEDLKNMLTGIQYAPDSKLVTDLKRLQSYLLNECAVFNIAHFSKRLYKSNFQSRLIVQLADKFRKRLIKMRKNFLLMQHGVVEKIIVPESINECGCECDKLHNSQNTVYINGSFYEYRGLYYPKSVAISLCGDMDYACEYHINYDEVNNLFNVRFNNSKSLSCSIKITRSQMHITSFIIRVFPLDLKQLTAKIHHRPKSINYDQPLLIEFNKHFENGNLQTINEEDYQIIDE